jgi:apolipoprotein N-acyltransferase
VWLISFTLALTAALLCNLPACARAHRSWPGWCCWWRPGSPAWRSRPRLDQPGRRPLKVAAIQGNVEQDLKWDPAHIDAQLALYRDLSFSSKPVDLLVWPETAVPVLKDQPRATST